MIEIAYKFTDEDWSRLEKKMDKDFDNEELWSEALDIFESRLSERYIKPAEVIQSNLCATGEGFAIIAVLCSLIETLETFYQGKCYTPGKLTDNTQYGNGKSQSLFVDFLSTKEPFKSTFSGELATDFYKNVRCSILHEAMTRNGWVIRTNTNRLVKREEGCKIKILNRRYFLKDLKIYVTKYKAEVLGNKERKDAFIRKMDCICKNV